MKRRIEREVPSRLCATRHCPYLFFKDITAIDGAILHFNPNVYMQEQLHL
jgi:hypothetical protein